MKRISLLLTAFLSVCLCFGQNGHSERTFKRLENKLYIVENGIKYKVDETRVIAKLKPQRELPRTLCEKSQNLGFDILEIPVPDGMRVEDYVSIIERTDDFEYVDYNTYGKYFFTPNDSLIGNGTGCQWYLDKIYAYNAWNITKGSSSVKVAVLDTGVDSCHYDLHYGSDNYTHLDILNGYNYVHNTNYSTPLNRHGTMVAGIIGAKTNNNRGISGISGGNHSAGITIVPYTVGDNEPSVNHVISAISNAVGKGVKIINMSFGIIENNGVNDAISNAYNQGVTIICASGNGFNSSMQYPASHSYTIAVGASGKTNQKLDFSNYGNGLDLVAPGIDIKSTSLNNGYYSDYGTSFAAPQVAGVAALLLSVNPSLTPSQIRSILHNTCTKPSGYSYSNGWNSEVGYGVLNAFAAVASLLDYSIVGAHLISSSRTYSIDNLPSGLTVEWSLSNNYYNQNCLQQNYPSQGQCMITRDFNQDMMNATLTATIKHNGVTIKTLTKTGLYAYNGFKGQYSSGGLSGDINYTHVFYVRPVVTTSITSQNLIGATVSYDNVGTIPTSFYMTPTTSILNFVMPSNNNGIPVIINVNDVCGNNYQLYAFPMNNKSLNMAYDDNGITIVIGNGDDSSVDLVFDQPWMVEIRNATTGTLMASQSSSSRSETISTAGWPKGIYVVKATVGKEVLTEKVMVR